MGDAYRELLAERFGDVADLAAERNRRPYPYVDFTNGRQLTVAERRALRDMWAAHDTDDARAARRRQLERDWQPR